MNKIDMIEDSENIVQKKLDIVTGAKLPWREYLKIYGYDKQQDESLEDMCNNCIKRQKDLYGQQEIKCHGLNNFKNTISGKYGAPAYNQIVQMSSEEDIKAYENLYNPLKWLEDVMVNDNPLKKMFDPRWYQSRILNCSATRKVLRMGRRCIEQNQRIKGRKKSYSVKHLFHLARYHKRLPEIQTYNQDTGEITYTDKYYLLPNPTTTLLHFIFSDGTETKVTTEHPLLTYDYKQVFFKEAREFKEGERILTNENSYKVIKDIKILRNQKTYHLTVLNTHTFVDSNGLIHHNTGKALDINTPIPTPNGWTTMEFVKKGDKVFDDAGNICNVTFATEIQYNRTCYEIEFDNGDKLIADEDHQWNVSTRNSRKKDPKEEKTVTTKDLLDFEGKYYGIRLTTPVNYPTKTLSVDPYLLGFWLGDGRSSDGRLTIGDEDASEIINLLNSRGYEVKKLSDKYMYSVKGLTTSLKYLNLLNNKHIPENYLQSDVSQRLELLRGLMDSDGSFLSRDRNMEFTTSLEKLSEDFKDLVKSLGIKTTRNKNKSFLNGKQCKDRFRFTFKTHLKVFNLLRKDKNSKVQTYSRSNFLYIKDITPVETRPVKCISVDSPKNLYLAGRNYIITHNTASMTVGLLHRLLSTQEYRVLMVAPMQTMVDEVYDTIKKYCDKMGDGIITGASTNPIHEISFNNGSTFKGITAGAQGAKAARGKGADLIYVDECLPAFSRITMSDGSRKAIVDVDEGDYVLSYSAELGKFIPQRVITVKCTGVKDTYRYTTIAGKHFNATENHPVLTSEGWKPIHLAKDIAVYPTKKGFDIFFETIIKVKKKGTERVYNLTVDQTNSYIADNFVVHNCDFLSRNDMNSILAILIDTADTEFWASSTPMGENNLYRLSTLAAYKEFHYPTYAIPHYDDTKDRDFKSNMDQTGIIQELLADFGADDNMVFQLQFIENCTLEREKSLNVDNIYSKRSDYYISMGVDWNHDKVGTRIVVLARHKLGDKYMIVEKATVAMQGWTQVLAVEKIIELNRKWVCDFLYVDEGFGSTQASYLRQAGMDILAAKEEKDYLHKSADVRLLDLVSVRFGSHMTIIDNITGQEISKKTKQFMVENYVNIVSEGKIILQEDEDRDIILQMKNYYIKNRTVSGQKVFEPRDKVNIGDHDLDALMLAVFGFKENLEDQSNISYQFHDVIMSPRESVGYAEHTVTASSSEQVSVSEHFKVSKSLSKSSSRSRAKFKPRKKW